MSPGSRRSCSTRPRPTAWVGRLAALAVVLVGLACFGAAPAGGVTGDPLVAPATTLSADGRVATDGVRTLAISQAGGLDPAGQVVEVSGTGYDTFKGVYVAFCVIPPTNQQPTPCGGGADQSGSTGASNWISSNPPPQGVGLAVPYGEGGSFRVTVNVAPTINDSIDCRRVRCAVVTRNDHTRSTDRSQDILVPVTFAEAPVATPPDPGVWAFPAAPTPDITATTAPSTTGAPSTTTSVPEGTTTTTEAAADELPDDDELAVGDDDQPAGTGRGTNPAAVVAGVSVVGVLAGVAGWLLWRRRASAPSP